MPWLFPTLSCALRAVNWWDSFAKRVYVSLLRGIAPVLGEEAVLAELANNGRFNAVAVAIGDNHTRKLVMGRLRSELPRTVSFPAIVHPSAVIGSRALIGDGSVLLAGAVRMFLDRATIARDC